MSRYALETHPHMTVELAREQTRRRRLPVELMLNALPLALAFCSVEACLAAPSAIEIEIDHPWCAATPKGVTTGACYVTVRNTGAAEDKILGAAVERSEHVEIHRTTIADGVGRMRPLSGGVSIPAMSVVDFRDEGYHLMLVALKAPLVEGESFRGSITFEHRGSTIVEFKVEAPRAPHGHMHGG